MRYLYLGSRLKPFLRTKLLPLAGFNVLSQLQPEQHPSSAHEARYVCGYPPSGSIAVG